MTMVAAWIRALTEVGASMASGSHTCRGTCADLPTAPIRKPKPARASINPGSSPAAAFSIISNTLKVPVDT